MGLADQAGSEMVPGWPLPVVAILVKETEPKFASGSARQTRRERHCAGACTIQSAEDRSGAAMLNCFVTLVRLVRFLIWRRTLVPSTLIDAVCTPSPTWFGLRPPTVDPGAEPENDVWLSAFEKLTVLALNPDVLMLRV